MKTLENASQKVSTDRTAAGACGGVLQQKRQLELEALPGSSWVLTGVSTQFKLYWR